MSELPLLILTLSVILLLNSTLIFHPHPHDPYIGTLLVRNNAPLGPYNRTVRMILWWV